MFRLCILSSGRPTNARRFLSFPEAIWYVGKGEEKLYRHNGANHIVESGGLVESRNQILKDCWAEKSIAITIEDH